MSKSTNLKQKIKDEALRLGFELVGVASATDPYLDLASERYRHWIGKSYHASMQYLEKHQKIKEDPTLFLPDTKSIIMVGLNYGTELVEKQIPKISVYARSKDYHVVLKEKLHVLQNFIQTHFKESRTRSFVDAEPVLERFWAQRAGLGWIGKNSLVLHKKLGSLFFIGGLMTTLEMESDQPTTEHCGKCTRCIDACPTTAILENRQVDSNRCISFHTIESKSTVPNGLESRYQGWIAGCDICQNVCPWNSPAVPSRHFENTNPFYQMQLEELCELSFTEYKSAIKDTALSRIKYIFFLRNLFSVVQNEEKNLSQKKRLQEKIKTSLEKLESSSQRDEILSSILQQMKLN